MCKPTSFIIDRNHNAWRSKRTDSHYEIVTEHELRKEGYINGIFLVPVKIAPKNGDISRPLRQWAFHIDMDKIGREIPIWFDGHRAEKACRREMSKRVKNKLAGCWSKEAFNPTSPLLDTAKPFPRDTLLALLQDWALVRGWARDSVRASVEDWAWTSVEDSAWDWVWNSVEASVRNSVSGAVWESVWDSIKDSVKDSVRDVVWDSVEDSVEVSVRDSVSGADAVWDWVWVSLEDAVRDSVRGIVWDSLEDVVRDSVSNAVWDLVWNSADASAEDSIKGVVWDSLENAVWAYIGSLFPNIKTWRYMESEHPWDSLRSLWTAGYLPSFDGDTWRLHRGPDAEIVLELSDVDLY